MTVDEMKDLLQHYGMMLEYDELEKIKDKPHHRRDICAMLILDRLCPGETVMITDATRDEIWFESSPERVAENANEHDMMLLAACGVDYQDDSFHMYV